MQRFLIIQTAFLGDVILATPIISELKRIYPSAMIDVVVRKGNETLLANNPKINQRYVWNKKSKKYWHLFQLIKAIRRQRYDEVITVQRFANAGFITLFSKARKRIGFRQNTFSWMYSTTIEHSLLDGSHEVERNLKLVAHHGAKKRIRPELFPSEADKEKVKEYQQGTYFCLAPASVWETKRLPINKWKEIIELLKPKGAIYLIGGPDDVKLCDELCEQNTKNILNLAGKLTLLQSAALMGKAQMNYVNDSGPLHIASAMNAPTRAFFCSTVPLFGFGPLSDDAKVIESAKKLECRPCTFHGRKECPLKHYDCGHTIEITEESIH